MSPTPSDRESGERSSFESDVLEELQAFVLEARGPRSLSALGPDASLERDLGLGSLEKVELLSRLEARFRRRAPERTLGEAQTPRDLARAFQGAREDERGGWETASPRDSRNRLPAPGVLPGDTVTAILLERGSREPELPHIHLKEDGRPEATISFGDLYREALLVAGALREGGLRAGDAVAIMLATSRGFFSTFMGVLLAGGVPVPLYPPFSRARIEEYARRQTRILRNAEATLLIAAPEARSLGAVLEAKVPSLRRVVGVEDLLEISRAVDPDSIRAGADDVALIQYTSGSTGDPKGIPLSHRNLLSNIRAIGQALRIGPSDVGVSWLPLYHDMGLIGAWLTPMAFGIPVAILSPLSFLASPAKWLWTIHRRRGTISPAPNFAYELSVRKIADRDVEGIDLSSWRVALNGAEPISPRTLEGFEKKFSKYGFRKESFLPVYGLAESALLLTAADLDSEVRVETIERAAFETEGAARRLGSPRGAALRFVSVGRPVPGHEVRILDEKGEVLPERREGRLVFRGPSAMSGYYRNEAATKAILGPDGFLDSGDRGFLAGGELFVTGRTKDLIIKAGRNLIPQEIESAASEVPGVRRGSVAAFGVSDPESGTERLVVVVEAGPGASGDRDRVAAEVERSILEIAGVPPDEVVMVGPRTVPKTSSGKIRRSSCRESYLQGDLGRRARPSLSMAASLLLRSGRSGLGRAVSAAGRLVYGLYLLALTLAFVLPAFLLLGIGIRRDAFRRLLRRASRLYLALAGIPFEIRSRDRLREIAAAGPAVLVSNHASYLDPVPLMAALDLDYAFAVKQEAVSWPLLGRAIRRLEHIPIDRKSAGQSASSARALREALSRGRSVVLFPEATFTRAAGLRPFKLGAFQLAAETGAPLVPLALSGTRRLLRDGTWIPKRVPVTVEIGEPIRIEGSFAAVVRSKERVADELARRVGEPRLDLVSAGLEYS